MKKLEAILFDMDGTLLDSEPLWLRSDLAMIAAHGGFMTEEEHDRFIGMGAASFIPFIKEKYGIKTSYQELVNFQERTYLEIARSEITAFPEMVAFARWAVDQGLPVAIASGSTNAIIDEMLDIAGIKDLFSVLVSSQEVEAGKPEPYVFLEACRRLRVSSGGCLVMEDSPIGVEAAHRAGMHIAAVPSPLSLDPDHYFSKADKCFKGGMTVFKCTDMIRWVQENFQV
jgi:HAD superfamily hydrolase (TIGR01509 family)